MAAIVGLLSAPDRLPGVAVLPGEAGLGKTSLWLAGVDAAAERGYRILSSRPSEAETRFSFAGLTDLLGSAGDVVAELPPDSADGHRGTRLHAEPSPRPHEVGLDAPPVVRGGRGVHRTHPRDLIPPQT